MGDNYLCALHSNQKCQPQTSWIIHLTLVVILQTLFKRNSNLLTLNRKPCLIFVAVLRNLDVAVLLDWSTSFRDDHWNYILDYVRGFVDRLGISPDPRGTHVCLIGYSSSASVVFNFKAPQNVAYVKGRLNGVTRQAGYRRPDKALELGRSNLFTVTGGARQGAKRVNYTFSLVILPVDLVIQLLESTVMDLYRKLYKMVSAFNHINRESLRYILLFSIFNWFLNVLSLLQQVFLSASIYRFHYIFNLM